MAPPRLLPFLANHVVVVSDILLTYRVPRGPAKTAFGDIPSAEIELGMVVRADEKDILRNVDAAVVSA